MARQALALRVITDRGKKSRIVNEIHKMGDRRTRWVKIMPIDYAFVSFFHYVFFYQR